MNFKLTKSQKERLRKPLYNKLKKTGKPWYKIANDLGFMAPSALAPWNKEKKVPLNRVYQVQLLLDHYQRIKENENSKKQ